MLSQHLPRCEQLAQLGIDPTGASATSKPPEAENYHSRHPIREAPLDRLTEVKKLISVT